MCDFFSQIDIVLFFIQIDIALFFNKLGWNEDQRRALMTGWLVVGYFKNEDVAWKMNRRVDTLVDWDSLGEKHKQLDRFEILNTTGLKNSY